MIGDAILEMAAAVILMHLFLERGEVLGAMVVDHTMSHRVGREPS